MNVQYFFPNIWKNCDKYLKVLLDKLDPFAFPSFTANELAPWNTTKSVENQTLTLSLPQENSEQLLHTTSIHYQQDK